MHPSRFISTFTAMAVVQFHNLPSCSTSETRFSKSTTLSQEECLAFISYSVYSVNLVKALHIYLHTRDLNGLHSPALLPHRLRLNVNTKFSL